MGFIKGIGEFLGETAGTVVGKSVKWVGEKTNIKLIEDIGEGAYQSTKRTGRLLGQALSGTVDLATGIITNDDSKIKEGFSDVGGAVTETVTGIYKGAKGVVNNGKQVVEGIAQNDTEKLLHGAKGLAKTVGVGMLAVGVLDIVDGLDGITETVTLANVDLDTDAVIDGELDSDLDTTTTDNIVTNTGPNENSINENAQFENPNTHHVDPYWRHLKDGREVWVDGIPNPNVHGTEGWEQDNPNYEHPPGTDSKSHLNTFVSVSTRNKEA